MDGGSTSVQRSPGEVSAQIYHLGVWVLCTVRPSAPARSLPARNVPARKMTFPRKRLSATETDRGLSVIDPRVGL
jgi:hypothetical protein